MEFPSSVVIVACVAAYLSHLSSGGGGRAKIPPPGVPLVACDSIASSCCCRKIGSNNCSSSSSSGSISSSERLLILFKSKVPRPVQPSSIEVRRANHSPASRHLACLLLLASSSHVGVLLEVVRYHAPIKIQPLCHCLDCAQLLGLSLSNSRRISRHGYPRFRCKRYVI